MTMPATTELLGWIRPPALTLATLAGGWLAGRVLARAVAVRLPAPGPGDRETWQQAITLAVRDRLPTWGVLTALWLSATYWPLSPQALVLLERVVFVAAATSLTAALASVTSAAVGAYGDVLAPALPVSSLTKNVVWAAVVTTGGLIILNGLGLSIAPMLTALGVGGLAVALALQEPLSNFFAGVFITLAGQIRVGDYVVLDTNQQGVVADISWRSTRLRMLGNSLVVVPNAKLAQAVVLNHDLPSRDLAVLVEVGVDYDSDLDRVERVVTAVGRDVMLQVPGGVSDFEPFIRFHTFADSSVNFTTILRAQSFVDQYLVKHEFVRRLHRRFEQEGIVIPFPMRTLTRRTAAPARSAR